MNKHFERLDGQRFGRLLVWSYHGKNKHNIATWFCECDCGGSKVVQSGSLKSGVTNSCGCIGKEHPSHTKHGDKGKRIYNIWKSMNERCNTKTCLSYKHYGGRGISVCEEWREYINFRDWSYANGYSESLTIDRIDVNANYEPSNCKWSTRKEQARNTTRTAYCQFNGETYCVAELAEKFHAPYKVVYQRFRKGICPIPPEFL